jgi:hypothetical protein
MNQRDVIVIGPGIRSSDRSSRCVRLGEWVWFVREFDGLGHWSDVWFEVVIG